MATIGSFKKVGRRRLPRSRSGTRSETISRARSSPSACRPKASASSRNPAPPTTKLQATESSSAEPRSAPPGRSAPRKVATTFRSSSTTPPSRRPSTPTCSTTRVAKATPCCGRGRARTASNAWSQAAPSGPPGGASLVNPRFSPDRAYLRRLPLARSARPSSSGATRSAWLMPSALASSNNVTTVGLRRPRSRPLIYCWVKPEASAKLS